jgi:hypothetical protein
MTFVVRGGLVIALALGSSLGCGGASARASSASQAPLTVPLATAAERVRRMIERVDDSAIDAAFSKRFLSAVPREKVVEILTSIGAEAGACRAIETIRVDSETEGSVRIVCEHVVVRAKIATQDSAPYLMDGLVVKSSTR